MLRMVLFAPMQPTPPNGDPGCSKPAYFSRNLTPSANCRWRAEGGRGGAKTLHFAALLAFRQLHTWRDALALSGAGQPVALDQDLGDLPGLRRRSFATIVRDHPQSESVRHHGIPADTAHEN